ncbi:MAG TPA: hypothetical protein PKZ76_14600 [Xanthomonadaceae bacterium]|nr:hypothetical protein [Xanthomonadaceae bacterium]
MQVRTVILAASLLLLPAAAWSGETVEADPCGIDGWGWQLGEMVFEREHAASESTRIVVAGIYVGVGRQLVVSETIVRGAAVARSEPGSHLAEAPRKQGIPHDCVARRVSASLDPARPLD